MPCLALRAGRSTAGGAPTTLIDPAVTTIAGRAILSTAVMRAVRRSPSRRG